MVPKSYHLVHANLAVARAPLDDPLMAEFMANAGEIDSLAHTSQGFVAQPTPADEGTVYSEPALLNISIWESIESLRTFTYSGRHAEMLGRRAEWFVQSDRFNYVLFWYPAGEVPTEKEFRRRFEHLHQHGPTSFAFTFDHPFTVKEMLAFSAE